MVKKKLIVASNNSKKIEEIREILPQFNIQSLKDINFHEDIVEDGNSFEDNAYIKASFIAKKFKTSCIADDSGLCVNALNGAPGIYSARYAGEDKNDTSNNLKLLQELATQKDRSAYFITCICYFDYEYKAHHFFEGKIVGSIADEPKGDKGFGYDPLFIPQGFEKTFAQMDAQEKNKLSHRGKALEAFIGFLENKE